MLGFAILGLLGVGLIVNLADDDDDDNVEATPDPENEDQTLSTEDSDETIETEGGDDTVFSQGGNDLVSLGEGDDRGFGGDDSDAIFGDAGDDFIRGQGGSDQVFGGAGEDSLFGDAGNDTLYGADILDDAALFEQTAETNFLLFDNSALFDTSADPAEADTLNGGVGEDVIFAGSNDVVDTGSGADTVNVGEWVDPDAPVEITGFTPAADVIVYSYTGPTEPNVSFGEDDTGLATLDVDGESIATFPGVDFFDLTAESAILLERLS